MENHRCANKKHYQQSILFLGFFLSLHCSSALLIPRRYRNPSAGSSRNDNSPFGTMGARISASSGSTDIGEQPRPKTANTSRNAEKEAWKREVQAFTQQALDPSYVNHPVRRHTIEAATLYPSASSTPTLLPGSHKHLGGAYDPTDGCIYGVPANSPAILCLYPDDCTGAYKLKSIPLPERIRSRSFKWLRGIFAHGYLWAIPAWADCVLCVDVDAYWGRRKETELGIVQLLDLPAAHTPSQWQWHGAGINQEKTAIYCIPSNAHQVLKVDCQTKQTSLIPIHADAKKYPSFTVDTRNKWYGGIRGADNCVYGIPYRSCAVLQIDCTTDTVRLVGPDYGLGRYNWHGGIAVAGKIYAHPSHARTVLVIDTNRDTTSTSDATIASESPRIYKLPIPGYEDSTETYKWLGGSVGSDGNIYCPACDTSAILKIDVDSEACVTYGFTGTEKNKWQGGVLARDGCIYCIPASGVHVCRISPDAVQLVGDLSPHKDKWQGGHVGQDGCLYFIPENGYRVLKVTPPMEAPKLVDGKLPEGDVQLELL